MLDKTTVSNDDTQLTIALNFTRQRDNRYFTERDHKDDDNALLSTEFSFNISKNPFDDNVIKDNISIFFKTLFEIKRAITFKKLGWDNVDKYDQTIYKDIVKKEFTEWAKWQHKIINYTMKNPDKDPINVIATADDDLGNDPLRVAFEFYENDDGDELYIGGVDIVGNEDIVNTAIDAIVVIVADIMFDQLDVVMAAYSDYVENDWNDFTLSKTAAKTLKFWNRMLEQNPFS